jgi:hypothetical protein
MDQLMRKRFDGWLKRLLLSQLRDASAVYVSRRVLKAV